MSRILSLIKEKWCEFLAIYNEWPTLTPKRKLLILFNLGKYSCLAVGVRLYLDAKIKWYSYFLVVVIGVYYSLAMYTMVYHAMDGHILEGLKCFSISGLYISVCCTCIFTVFLHFYATPFHSNSVFPIIIANTGDVCLHWPDG